MGALMSKLSSDQNKHLEEIKKLIPALKEKEEALNERFYLEGSKIAPKIVEQCEATFAAWMMEQHEKHEIKPFCGLVEGLQTLADLETSFRKVKSG
jgi:hypothetical protein